MKQIKSKVILENGDLYSYSLNQMFTDGSYVLSVQTEASTSIKEIIRDHCEELHQVEIAAICGTYENKA